MYSSLSCKEQKKSNNTFRPQCSSFVILTKMSKETEWNIFHPKRGLLLVPRVAKSSQSLSLLGPSFVEYGSLTLTELKPMEVTQVETNDN